jgi:glycosyltransferase involved in cell wall biosynthesis
MIGRNNRDWMTFVDVAKLVDVKCIAVTDGTAVGDVPENVKIHVNLPMQDCINLIRFAKINLVLLKDDDRGAGHITSVIAMSAGIPQIVTQSNSLREYFIGDLHGFGAIPNNPEDVARKVTRLISDRKLHTDMSVNAANYAKRWFSEDYGSLRLSAIIEAVLHNQELGAVDPQWHTQFIADLERASQITVRVSRDQSANACPFLVT